MTIQITYLNDNGRIKKKVNTAQEEELLNACLNKIKESPSITELACQPEARHTFLASNGEAFRLGTVRINNQARLFYTTHQNIFIPLDICWSHNMSNFNLTNEPITLINIANDIVRQFTTTPDDSALPSKSETTQVKKAQGTKATITLTAEQEKVVGTFAENQAILCFGPPGTGKTEIAKQIINLQNPGITTRYLTLGARLCSQVNAELANAIECKKVTSVASPLIESNHLFNDSSRFFSSRANVAYSDAQEEMAKDNDESSLPHFRCETWDDLHGSLINVFENVKDHLTRLCQKQHEIMSLALKHDTKKSKKNIPPTQPPKTEHDLLLDELEQIILVSQNKRIAEFGDFNNWYKSNKKTKSKQDSCQGLTLEQFDPYQLFAEFTRIIIQQGGNIREPYLPLNEYLALSDGQSYILKSPAKKRQFAHEFFEKYKTHLEGKLGLYDPHLHMHHIFLCIEKIARMDFSIPSTKASANDDDQPELAPDFLEEIRTDALVFDEAQQMPVWLFHILMVLKPTQLFLFADPHQIMGPQSTRIIEPMRKVFSTYKMEQKIFLFNRNFRNAQLIGAIANILLNFERQIYGSSERAAEFILDCSDTVEKGTVDCQPDDANAVRPEKGDLQAVIIVPDNFEITAQFKARWGNNVLRISIIGGLEWENVTLVGFSQSYSKELKELQRLQQLHPLQLPSEQSAYARRKTADENVPSLAVRDALHRLYTIATRAKNELHIVDDNPFLKNIVDVIYSRECAISVVAEKSAIEITKPAATQSESPSLDWLDNVRKYIIEEAYEVAFNIMWGEEVWGNTLRPEIQEFLSLGQDSAIDLYALIRSLFEFPALKRAAWLTGIMNGTLASKEKNCHQAIRNNNSIQQFQHYEAAKQNEEIEAAKKSVTASTSQVSCLAPSKMQTLNPRSYRHQLSDDEKLVAAIKNKNVRLCREWLRLPGKNVNQILPGCGCSPLLIATGVGCEQIVELLLEHKADPNLPGDHEGGMTALSVAIQRNHIKIVEVLIKYGANVNNKRKDNEATPLYIAVEKEYLHMVKILLRQENIDVNAAIAQNGRSPLILAVIRNNLSIVNALLEHKNIDVTYQMDCEMGYRPTAYILAQIMKYDAIAALIDSHVRISEDSISRSLTV